MKPHRILLSILASGVLAGAPAWAVDSPASHDHASAERASLSLQDKPFAPVYIVTSRDTYTGIGTIARNGIARRDSLGSALVVSEIKAHQLEQVSDYIHRRERRCGGFFAFATRAQADAFIRNDRAANAIGRSRLVDYTIDNQATVDPWVSQVSESNLYDTIDHLQGYQNRYYTSSTGKTSAEWIRNTWQALAGGRSDVSSELFNCSSCSTQPSVILTLQGAELPTEVVVLGAHLDSTAGGSSNSQRAPGADDDASGIATLTEVIRIALASGWQPRRTVKFMGYAAEEAGLRGSNAIAQAFANDGVNVVGVMQLDMTNYKVGAVDDMQLVTDYSNAGLKTFLTDLFDEYLAPLGLSRGTYTCGYGCSDHASWTSAGFPAAMMFEAGDANGYNPYIHSSSDTLANMGNSAEHSVKFAQLGLAFLGELAKTAGGGGGNTAPTAGFSFTTSGLVASFTDSSSDSDGSIASRSWNFGDGGSSTATNPSHTYAAGGTFSVTLTVTDNDGATDTETKSVTVTGGGGSVLQNGVPRTGISGASKSNQYFTLVVPSGASNLRFVTSGGSGDADLYVKFGSQPSTTNFDCKSEGSTTAETCTISNVQAGTYHVLVHAWSAISGVSLTGSFDSGGGNTNPVANFTSSISGLTVNFTDSSTDSDGTIASRSWNFGDGGSSTQTNPSRTYAAGGTYSVTLTVTDNDGATDNQTKLVTVTGGGGGSQTYTNSANYNILDNATVESPIAVSGRSGNGLSNTQVAVNIVHTYIGDLKVDLVAPDGSVYVLHNRSGGSANNINKTYTVNLSSEALNGTWKLRVNDNYDNDTGYINSWSVTF